MHLFPRTHKTERCKIHSSYFLLRTAFGSGPHNYNSEPQTTSSSLMMAESLGRFTHILGDSLSSSSWSPYSSSSAMLNVILLPLHCLSSFQSVDNLFLCCDPSTTNTWEVAVPKRAKKSLSTCDKVILLVLIIEHPLVHSFIYPFIHLFIHLTSGNEHFQWLGSHAQRWGCNSGHADVVSPSRRLQLVIVFH